ncbi:transcriptional regulator [Thermococcus chitonophagus]|uniref:Transcriptional regulator n=1 Tax=Thermococcus chitonophagus TaxID=54262 RepID=A0A160VQV5_9EURY|nr:Lrp/AsnC family transcriptional regulator [Thermococcus chitonophagus]ASJ15695.1 transcriptional regulator [Thermococcus chitonophagus]CUX76909.1 Transcriptional regulator, AsnC family [Thermococcus chitonophagus]
MPGVDEIDEIIARELRKNGRATLTELGKKVGLTPSAIKNRIEKLEKLGVIKGYSAIIDPSFFGEFITAVIEIELIEPDSHELESLLRPILKMRNIVDVYKKTGEFQLVIRGTFRDVEALNGFIRDIRRTYLKNLARRTRVSIVLENFKESGVILK